MNTMENDTISCDQQNGTLALLQLCTSSCFPDSNYECVKDVNAELQYIRYTIGLFLTLISAIGIFGNIITLLSIPFAMKKEKFGFEKNKETTIFILNLSCIDICYCLLPQSVTFFCNSFYFQFSSCQLMYSLANILGYTEAIAMALVAISRCLEITKNTLWTKISDHNTLLYSLAVITWIIGIVGFSIQINFDYTSDIGWDCELGVCGHIPWKLSSKFYLVSILLYSSSIAISYIIMWKTARRSGKTLTRSGSTTLDLEERQKRITRMILILLFSYFLCNIPMHLNYVFSLPRNFYYVSVLFYSAQYAINFIIYHLSYSQYRKASCYFVKHLFFKIFCSSGENKYQSNFSISKKANNSRTNTVTSVSRKNQT